MAARPESKPKAAKHFPAGWSFPTMEGRQVVDFKGMDTLEYLLFEPSLDSVCGTVYGLRRKKKAARVG